MKKLTYGLVALLTLVAACESDDRVCGSGPAIDNPVIVMETTLGDITVVLYPLDAPVTVGNFLAYVHEGFYDSLIVHRAIFDLLILGGGYDQEMRLKEPRAPIPNEANNGLKNVRGSIAMFHTDDPQSATSQFFINLQDSPFFDFTDETDTGWGFCVFGRVTGGMDVADTIGDLPTTFRGGFDDVPVEPVFLLDVYVKN